VNSSGPTGFRILISAPISPLLETARARLCEPAERMGSYHRGAMARVVDQTPKIFTHENPEWCVEFRNPINGEVLTVTYSGPRKPAQQN
jgi:hypothetical protein